MRVSVVIPVLNEVALVRGAIERAWRAGADEVIVADGGSGDGTAEAAAAARCLTVVSATGRAVQQNHGASRATGDVLLFLHVDTWLEPAAVDQIRAALANERVCGGAFRQRIDARGFRYRLLERGDAWRVRWLGLPYGDQGIFLRRDVFRELGGFPEAALMEDVLLMRRLGHWRRQHRARFDLLTGPLHVNARRWERYGVIRQTLRNWMLLAAFLLGASPDRLARFYPRHDRPNR